MVANTLTQHIRNQQEDQKRTSDIADINKQVKEDQLFFQRSEKDREKETKYQDQEIVALKEKLLKDNAGFLERLEASPVGRKLLLKIEEKRNELLSDVNIDQYKEFLPHCIQHGLPIYVKSITQNDTELENLLKEFDAIIATMKPSEIEMIKSLVTLVKIGKDCKGRFDINDGYIEVKKGCELGLDWRAVFEHEFTHLKEFYLCIVDPEFHSKLEKINSDIDMSNLDIVEAGLGRPIWKSEVRELHPGMVNEQGDGVRKIILKDGKVIEWVVFSVSGCEGGIYVNDQPLTPETHKDLLYRSSITAPKDGFINSYSKSKGRSDSTLVLGEFLYPDIKYDEQLTTITETYYDDPSYFAELFFHSKTGESIPLNEKYDHLSNFPALRKKLRLMIEYGFFPEGEFAGYIEEEWLPLFF